MVPAQCREQDLPLASTWTARSTSHKTVNSHRGLGKRRFAMRVIPRAVVAGQRRQARDRRHRRLRQPAAEPGLFPHAALSPSRDKAQLLLRHAVESRRRVLDERMDRFVARYRVRYVTLLRPEETAAAVAVKKIDASGRRGLALRVHLRGVVVHQLLGDAAGIEIPLAADLRHRGDFRRRAGDEAFGEAR